MRISDAHDQPISEVEEVLSLLLKRAEHTVRISTALSTGIFLHAGPRQALLDCLSRLPDQGPGGRRPMQVLLDSRVTPEIAGQYDWWLKHPKVSCLVSQTQVPHLMIIDENTFRLEHSHERTDSVRSNSLVIDAEETISSAVVRMFDGMMANGRPLAV